MTITILTERNLNNDKEATFEYERDAFYARVYERFGEEWKQTHESLRYKDRAKAKAAFRRFTNKYIKQ